MKSSRYNLIAESGTDGTRLLFNGGSAALAEIDSETWETVARLLATPACARTDQEQELLGHLVYGKYLVADEIDEVEALKVRNRRQRFANSTFFLTIAPTLACNFACEYCFESRNATIMTPDIEDAVIALAERQLARSENMLITWFGGEPTLCIKTIERLQGAFHEIAARQNVSVRPATIITNGYLLDRQMAQRLAAADIRECQVTLDGPERIHDSRRKLRNGGGSFRRIIENLAESADILHVIVRVNVDTTNVDASWEVIGSLEDAGVLKNVQVYFAPVNDTDGVCADMRGRCFTTEEFAREQIKLYRDLMKRGFYQIEYPSLASGGYCGADSENSYVIGPNGLLFKCWEELSLDPARSVGSLLEEAPAPQQQANEHRYLGWDPFEKVECVECDVLPICMGGCPVQGIKLNSPARGYCSSWKYNLGDMLQLRYLCEQRKEVKP